MHTNTNTGMHAHSYKYVEAPTLNVGHFFDYHTAQLLNGKGFFYTSYKTGIELFTIHATAS